MQASVTASWLRTDSRRVVLPVWLGMLVVLGCWLLARPYAGLRHDGILYVGQSLLRLMPETMSKDIFFAHGSQDDYSIVSSILASMYTRWGVDLMQIVIPSLAHAGLMVIAFLLLRSLPDFDRWMGLVAIAVMSHLYAGQGTFAFAERFVTGRTIAEPLALGALALVVMGRPWAGIVAVVLAAAVHPLVALPAMVIGWIVLVSQDRRWSFAGLLALLPILLALLDVRPFAALLSTYDDPWWKAVREVNGHVLLSRWRVSDWQAFGLQLAVLLAAWRTLPNPLARLAGATAAASVLLVVASGVGADLGRNVLITQLQLWRVLWLAQLLYVALVPAVLLRLWGKGADGRLAFWSCCLTVLAVNAHWDGGWVFMLWSAATVGLLVAGQVLTPRTNKAALAATWLALAGLTVASLARNAAFHGALDVPTAMMLALTTPTLAMPGAAALFLAWVHGRSAALMALLVAAASVGLGMSTWDRRDPWVRYVETGLERTHPFSAFIPESAQVYWHNNLVATWLMLRRPSHFSEGQGSGLLFARGTAIEYLERRQAYHPLNLQISLCAAFSVLTDGSTDADCAPSDEIVRDLCATPRGPDFVVFERKLAVAPVASWTFDDAHGGSRTYRLYDCSKLR